MESISTRIATARQMVDGLSAAQLGLLAGLSKSVVALIESGERKNPESKTVSAIAAVLGISTDWLLNGTGRAPTPTSVKAAIARAEEIRTGTNG